MSLFRLGGKCLQRFMSWQIYSEYYVPNFITISHVFVANITQLLLSETHNILLVSFDTIQLRRRDTEFSTMLYV